MFQFDTAPQIVDMDQCKHWDLTFLVQLAREHGGLIELVNFGSRTSIVMAVQQESTSLDA